MVRGHRNATLPKLAAIDGTLGFALKNGTLFYEWWASYSAQSMGRVTQLGHGGGDFDPDSSETQPPALSQIDFPTPPSGDWVVHVSVYFASGDASYAWHLSVP
jgi:hypothetical protein